MDNNTLLFQDKGSGRYKDVKIYPNRIEVLKKGTFGGKHTEIVYLKPLPSSGVRECAEHGDVADNGVRAKVKIGAQNGILRPPQLSRCV